MTGIFAVGLESIFRLIVSLLMFALVLVACYMTSVWIGNFQKGKIGQGNIENIEVHRLSNSKYISLTRVGKKYYVLAVSKDRVDKIDVLDEEDIELPEKTPVPVGLDFSQVLEKLKKRSGQEDKK